MWFIQPQSIYLLRVHVGKKKKKTEVELNKTKQKTTLSGIIAKIKKIIEQLIQTANVYVAGDVNECK